MTKAERDCTKCKGFIASSAIFMPRLNMLSFKRRAFESVVVSFWGWILGMHEYKPVSGNGREGHERAVAMLTGSLATRVRLADHVDKMWAVNPHPIGEHYQRARRKPTLTSRLPRGTLFRTPARKNGE